MYYVLFSLFKYDKYKSIEKLYNNIRGKIFDLLQTICIIYDSHICTKPLSKQYVKRIRVGEPRARHLQTFVKTQTKQQHNDLLSSEWLKEIESYWR